VPLLLRCVVVCRHACVRVVYFLLTDALDFDRNNNK
jgi:hypothetical protein